MKSSAQWCWPNSSDCQQRPRDDGNTVFLSAQKMIVSEYLRRVSERLAAESQEIGRDYQHPGVIGRSREDKVREFFERHLPPAFKISRGFLVSPDNITSPETDLLIVDGLWTTPLLGDLDSPIWLLESTYASIEVKSELSPQQITDCLEKCKKFKTLRRVWTNAKHNALIEDSLFVIWAFDSASTQTTIDNLSSAFAGVPMLQRPDLILVNDRFCAFAGSLQLLYQGREQYLTKRQQFADTEWNILNQPNLIPFECSSSSLAMFLFFLIMWLQLAAPRAANILNYFGETDLGVVRFPSNFEGTTIQVYSPTQPTGESTTNA
jgi:hypothetical protein